MSFSFAGSGCRLLILLLLGGLLFSGGCSNEQPEAPEEITQAAGYLPRLKKTKNEQLATLLGELAAEGALPENLRRLPIPHEENAAPSLESLIPDDARKKLFDEITSFFPRDSLTFSPIDWERALRFVERHDSTRISARRAIAGKRCDFQIDQTQAMTVDLSIVYGLHAIARMEAMFAKRELDEGNLPSAMEAVAAMFALAHCLDQQTHISCRLQAVHIRRDALLVLEAICLSELSTREILASANQTILQAMADWPEEQDAWKSDRALGLICYEYAQAGAADVVLTPEEMEELSDDMHAALGRFHGELLDADAVSYLNAMQQVLDDCDKPLFRRGGIALELPTFDAQAKDLNVTEQFSLAEVLIRSVPQGQALFALDRARMEAWQIGLATALGEPLPEFSNSPLSGESYKVIDREQRVAVWGIGATDSEWQRPVLIRKID